MDEERKLGVHISKEMIDDNAWDVMGNLLRQAGKSMAQQVEEKVLGEIEKTLGTGILNANGQGYYRTDDEPRLLDIVIMRQFTELGKPFSEEDLEDFASNAVGQRFDVDWLSNKYDQDEQLEIFIGKNREFLVQSVNIDWYAYAHKQMEKAIYATGIIEHKAMKSTGSFQAQSISKGKRGIAGQHVLSQMMPAIPVDQIRSFNVDDVTMDHATGDVTVSVSAELVQPIEQISINIDLGKGETE